MKKYLIILTLIFLSCRQALAINQELLLKLLEIKRESYLSKKGEINFDLTPSYSQDESIVPWTITKSQTISTSFNLRVGLTDRLEASLRIPYLSGSRKNYTAKWDSQQAAGFGDPSISFQNELLSEKLNRPAIYLNLGMTVPSAKSSYDNLSASELPLGSGFISYTLGFSLLKSIDPAVLYGGLDYQTNLKRGAADPADQINYNAGLAWALNQQISVSIGISGAAVGEESQQVGGVLTPVVGSYNRTGLSLGSTIVLAQDLYLSPTAYMGLTKDDTDFAFSFGITKKLREATR